MSTPDTAYALIARFTLYAGTPRETTEVQVWRAGTYDSPEAARGEWLSEGRDEADIVSIVPIAAQLSPGGQDALKALDDLAAFCSDDTATVDRHVAVIRAALAARQPVGAVPSIDYEDLLDQAKDLIHCGCSINGAFDWLLEQLTEGEALAAPPAQAVDLGQFREAVQEAYENADGGTLTKFSLEELLALIDSRVVGNGQA